MRAGPKQIEAQIEELAEGLTGPAIGRKTVAGAALGLILLALSAPVLAASHPLVALAIRGFFSRLCHQNPARSFVFDSSPVAICVRCLGIYSGVAGGAMLSRWFCRQRRIALRCFFAGLLLNAADVAAETLHLHGNLPPERFLMGALLGIAAGLLLTAPGERSVIALAGGRTIEPGTRRQPAD